jgi:hypothetical protein
MEMRMRSLPPGFEPLSIPLDHAICIPSKRIDYLKEQEDGSLLKGGAPPHASAIILLARDTKTLLRFRETFSQIGRVKWS